MDTGDIERELRAVYGAYTYLRAHDLAHVSTTSRLLRQGDLPYLARRVADELGELAGVVSGTHGHGGGRDDAVLEAYQSLYWLIVLAVAAGEGYDDVRPYDTLTVDAPAAGSAAPPAWSPDTWHDAARRRTALRAGFAYVAATCRRAGISVAEAVERDLSELRGKPYLDGYWESEGYVPDFNHHGETPDRDDAAP